MNKLLEKYLQEVGGSCSGGCPGTSASSGGCGLGPPISRGGSGVCTSYQDVEHMTKGYGGYKTQYNPDCMPDKLFTKECEGGENPIDIIDPENSVKTPMAPTELPEGGEAGENKKIIENYIKSLNEQDEEEIEKTTKKEIEVEEPPIETPNEPTQMPEGGEAAGNIPDTPGMEMPGEEEEVPQDPEYIGRVYELKKIYSRLVSIESFLNDASDARLLKLRNYVSSAIELFQTLINNIDAYKDNIDELIVLFYKFLLTVYTLLKKYYEQENEDDKQEEK